MDAVMGGCHLIVIIRFDYNCREMLVFTLLYLIIIDQH